MVTCAAVTPRWAAPLRSAPPHLGALCGTGPPRARPEAAATPAVRLANPAAAAAAAAPSLPASSPQLWAAPPAARVGRHGALGPVSSQRG